jgi:multidrug efflux pump subunit AcrA (membrane-fusion protein)
MWQKKSTTTTETSEPALALRPASARPVGEVSPYGSFAMEEQETSVNRQPRSHRFAWFLGIVLLVGTALGAGWALNHGASGQDSAPSPEAAPPPGIVALGMVDNEPRIRNLRLPLQGKVLEAAPEGKFLKKGELLLRLDSEDAALAVKGAEAVLQDARIQLEQAQILPKKHELDLKNQEQAVAIARDNKAAFFYEVDSTRKLLKDDVIKNRVAVDAVEAKYRALEGVVEVEKNKLRLLQLNKPAFHIDRAKSEVAVKEIVLRKARRALERCELRSTEDGTVLRVFVNPGEWTSPDSKLPVIQFCPTGKRIIRAEVLQEWASLVASGQNVVIEDDTRAGPKWNGTVAQVSDWITHKRDVMIEPFMVNDVRTLECLIDVAPGGPPLRMGQRVRVTIQQGN